MLITIDRIFAFYEHNTPLVKFFCQMQLFSVSNLFLKSNVGNSPGINTLTKRKFAHLHNKEDFAPSGASTYFW